MIERLGSTAGEVVVISVSVVGIYLAVIVATRIVGLRSFSKMSAFDFAMTVAVGSMIASVGLAQVALVDGVLAVALVFGLQFLVAWLRQRVGLGGAVDNEPLLLMHDGVPVDEHLGLARITLDDLRGRLRAANIGDVSQVRAVVLETTGDLSVLHGSGEVDRWVLEGVRGAERVGRPDAGAT